MKNQALVSWKDKSKKLKCRLLQFFFGALRVNLLCLQCMNLITDKGIIAYRTNDGFFLIVRIESRNHS